MNAMLSSRQSAASHDRTVGPLLDQFHCGTET
jgi:hypothetical protein